MVEVIYFPDFVKFNIYPIINPIVVVIIVLLIYLKIRYLSFLVEMNYNINSFKINNPIIKSIESLIRLVSYIMVFSLHRYYHSFLLHIFRDEKISFKFIILNNYNASLFFHFFQFNFIFFRTIFIKLFILFS